MPLSSSILTIGFGSSNKLVSLGFSSSPNTGVLFDEVVADLEKTPSERFARVGFGQPGFTTECQLLSNNISNLEKQPSPFFKAGFFQPGLFSECKLLTEIIEEFEK
jgi:hypothetical protein